MLVGMALSKKSRRSLRSSLRAAPTSCSYQPVSAAEHGCGSGGIPRASSLLGLQKGSLEEFLYNVTRGSLAPCDPIKDVDALYWHSSIFSSGDGCGTLRSKNSFLSPLRRVDEALSTFGWNCDFTYTCARQNDCAYMHKRIYNKT